MIGFVINYALIRGVMLKRIEYFLPWLVKVVMAQVVFPPALIYFYLHAEEMYDDYSSAPWLKDVILWVGMPMCELF